MLVRAGQIQLEIRVVKQRGQCDITTRQARADSRSMITSSTDIFVCGSLIYSSFSPPAIG